MYKLSFLFLLIYILLISPGYSEDKIIDQPRVRFIDATRAYNNDDYELASQIWARLADQGDVASKFNLAIMYEHGLGVKRDISVALNLYRQAALEKYPPAQMNLANLLYSGETGVADHLNRAKYWWTKAASRGEIYAQFRLGGLLAEQKDLENAKLWLSKAATQNHLESISLLHNLKSDFESALLGPEWINNQEPGRYTLQLLSTESKPEAISFLFDNGLSNSALFFTQYGWYSIVVGSFKTFSEAQSAVVNLPEHIRFLSPKPRQFSTIQKTIADTESATLEATQSE